MKIFLPSLFVLALSLSAVGAAPDTAVSSPTNQPEVVQTAEPLPTPPEPKSNHGGITRQMTLAFAVALVGTLAVGVVVFLKRER